MGDYKDLLTYLNDSMVTLKELHEKATILHNETATAVLETCSLYTPQIVIDHHEMVEDGKKFDKYISDGQEMKSELEYLLTKPQKSIDEYRTVLEELRVVRGALNS